MEDAVVVEAGVVASAVAEEEDVVAALATVIEEAVVGAAAEEAEMAEANKQIFLPALVTGNAPSSTVATPTLPGETTATNVNNPNQLAPEVVMTTEVETAEEALEVAEAVVDLVVVAAIVEAAEVVPCEEALETAEAVVASEVATEIVEVVVVALEGAVEVVPCEEAGAAETVIVPTKPQDTNLNKICHRSRPSSLPPQYFL